MAFPHTFLQQIEARPLEALAEYARNAKRHDESQIAKLVSSLREFGWTFPILTDEAGEIIAGHGRLMAARRCLEHSWAIPGWPDAGKAPVLVKAGLSESQKRAYRILDNRVAEDAGWDEALLKLDLADLADEGFDLDLTGFDADDLAGLLDGAGEETDAGGEEETAQEPGRPEPDEATRARLDRAWDMVLGDWCEHIRRAAEGGFLSPKITPGCAAWHFIRAKYLGASYPGVASLAFCPERFWTGGCHKKSAVDVVLAARTHAPSMRGIRFATDETPSFERVLAYGLPMAGGRIPLDFPAHLARDLIDEFSPPSARVLDPCHGWGGRYVGFLLSEKARVYVGVDPSPHAHAGLIRTRDTLAPFAEDDKAAEFIEQPFEDVELTGEFDFALTSPPYFKVEQYAGEETSTRRYRRFDAWVKGFYLPLLEKTARHLKPGGVFALQVGSQSYPLAETATKNAAACGLTLVEKRNAGMNNSLQQTPEETAEAILILRRA
jgi:ParB-like chromosome segregation protein Spo0J/SAM-dependent methyltransferase